MKRFAIFTAAAALLVLTACKKHELEAPSIDGVTELRIYPGMSYTLAVSEGSGHYEATTDPTLADLSFEYGVLLTVKTKDNAAGSAPLVIVDTQSGKTVKCTLMVGTGNYTYGWTVGEVKQFVKSTVHQAEIEADLQTKILPVGAIMKFNPMSEDMNIRCAGRWEAYTNSVPNRAVSSVVGGTFSTEYLYPWNLPGVYANMPMEQTVNAAMAFAMHDDATGDYAAHLFVVANKTISDTVDKMFYVNLTDYYRKKFPDAGVQAVIYRYVQRNVAAI